MSKYKVYRIPSHCRFNLPCALCSGYGWYINLEGIPTRCDECDSFGNIPAFNLMNDLRDLFDDEPPKYDFQPDWVSPPGNTIAERLEEKGFSAEDFSEKIELSLSETHDLIEGRYWITIGLARKLESVIGGSVEFWMSREFYYRKGCMRLG